MLYTAGVRCRQWWNDTIPHDIVVSPRAVRILFYWYMSFLWAFVPSFVVEFSTSKYRSRGAVCLVSPIQLYGYQVITTFQCSSKYQTQLSLSKLCTLVHIFGLVASSQQKLFLSLCGGFKRTLKDMASYSAQISFFSRSRPVWMVGHGYDLYVVYSTPHDRPPPFSTHPFGVCLQPILFIHIQEYAESHPCAFFFSPVASYRVVPTVNILSRDLPEFPPVGSSRGSSMMDDGDGEAEIIPATFASASQVRNRTASLGGIMWRAKTLWSIWPDSR